MSKRIRISGSAFNMIGGLIGVRGWLLRFARLVLARKTTRKPEKRKRGRPRKPEEIRQLVVRMASENGWGRRSAPYCAA